MPLGEHRKGGQNVMKKWIAILLFVCLSVSCVSCGVPAETETPTPVEVISTLSPSPSPATSAIPSPVAPQKEENQDGGNNEGDTFSLPLSKVFPDSFYGFADRFSAGMTAMKSDEVNIDIPTLDDWIWEDEGIKFHGGKNLLYNIRIGLSDPEDTNSDVSWMEMDTAIINPKHLILSMALFIAGGGSLFSELDQDEMSAFSNFVSATFALGEEFPTEKGKNTYVLSPFTFDLYAETNMKLRFSANRTEGTQPEI